uniref:C2 domain-containing protein n=1 Tax=Phytophthora ramorum TaxID=164328 RepID=H3HD60_PHYRM
MSSDREEYEDAPVDILPKEIRLADDADDTLPNTLVITVLQARHLQPAALRDTLSCYVKLTSLGVEYKTSVMTKTREPRWHEVFVFRAVDWTTGVIVSVRDRLPLKMHFLGQVAISSAEIASLPGMITQRWFQLRDKGAAGQLTGAELELKVALLYTKANDQGLYETGPAAVELEHGDAGLAELLQEREAAATIAALKQGDYQVQVHVIEARDLKGENLSGTSDPYCQVEIMGLSKKTSTKYDTLGCVFDEILFFNFPNIGRHELREASIKISVYDKERVLKDNLIGIYQLDCLSVYTLPDHELYRQWIAVHDNLNAKDRGIQGFLLVSVVVLGPGDALRVHDREAEIEQELVEATGERPADDNGPATTPPLVLVPPAIELKLQFLVVRVLRAEHLPAMDTGGLLIGAQGIDAFLQVVFAANAPSKTSCVTVKGRGNLAPDFYEELWLPAPESPQRVGLLLRDSDEDEDAELVGGLSESATREKMELEEEQENLLAAAPRWYNLYGPPLRGTNPKRQQLVSRHAELGSTYRGRVLVSMVRIESPRPEDGEKMHTKQMPASERERFERSIPKTVKYVLRGALFCGVELPRASQTSFTGGASQVRVTISLGPYTIEFESQEVAKDGSANFEQCLEHRSTLELPADLSQIPDIIVTLSRSVGGVVAATSRKEEFVSWLVLKEEIARRRTRHALESSQHPGVLLLRLGFGRVEMATRYPWDTDGDTSELFSPFRSPRVHREIRVHVFQARGLESPAGVARVPSPVVNVRCCGQQKNTRTRPNTPAPLFYESLVFLTNVPATDVIYTPEIVLQIFDVRSAPPAVLREPASITPKYTEANLDIVALGVRHLKALSTLGVRRPHVEFELVGGYFVDGSNVKRTQSDRIVAHVKLPMDTLYAPQLQIRVCDSTLGGLRKTTLASPTYRVEVADGAGSPFRSPAKRNVLGFSQVKDKKSKSGEKGTDDDVEYIFDEGQPEAEADYPTDDGIGVGDLNLPSVLHSHARASRIKPLEDTDPAVIEQRRREEERRYYASKSALLLSHRSANRLRGSALDSPRNSRDQEHHRAPYLQGRDWWISQYGGEELEDFFSSPALESYQLRRPVLTRPNLLRFERVRVQLRAGVFKGRITVMERRAKKESRSQEEERAKQEYLELRRLQDGPQPVIVRVYVLRGQNLQAKNSNGYSDPYLRLKLGSNRVNDRSNACASQLDISVWDRGLVSDQLIGSTTIDLEERWFHREWQEIGEGRSSPRKRDSNLKPIEYRHLYVPQSRSTSQGFLQLWVDILTTQEAARIEPVDICPPAPKTFEVRVVIWRAENVQDQAQSEINDYFVKAWMESGGDSGSSRAESTDTHWRCANGKPCWNWRLVMKTEFPPRSPEMARLHIQLWDKDVLKWNDVLGEAQLDLYKWLRRAYETNRSMAPFLELKRLSRQSVVPGGSYQNDHNNNVDENTRPSLAERKLAKTQKDEADAEAAINGLLDFMGLGKLPDDAEWIPIYFTDREAAMSMEMGRIGISVQIVPEDEAMASPVGKGQNAPNLNPYLPPPVGRMRFNANPVAMFKVLVGPQMCIRLSIICCCVGCVLFISVFGATLMSTLTYLQAVEGKHSRVRRP